MRRPRRRAPQPAMMAAASRQASVKRAVAIFRRLGLAGVASVVATWSCPGDAKPPSEIDLHWVAPARCPGPDAVRARVRSLLGKDAAAASSGDRLFAEGDRDGGCRAIPLELADQAGERRLSRTRIFPDRRPATASQEAAAITLALLARGEQGAAEPASASASSPRPEASPTPEASPAARPRPETPVASRRENGSPIAGTARDEERARTATWSPVLRLPVVIADVGACSLRRGTGSAWGWESVCTGFGSS